MAYYVTNTTPPTEVQLEILKFLSAAKLRMCRLVNTWLLAIIDQNADILPIAMRTFESVVSVLESLENYFDGKSVRMNLFLKGIRHSASFTGLGRKIEVLPSSTCENLGLFELCSFYGDRDEKLVTRSPVVWQKLIDEWFDAEDSKWIRKGGLPKLLKYCASFKIGVGTISGKEVRKKLFVSMSEHNGCHFIEFDKFVLRRLLIRKDIRNSENSCKFCGSVEHDGKDCVLHPNSKKPLNFNSIPEDFYGFIDEAVCAGTTKNSTYDDED